MSGDDRQIIRGVCVEESRISVTDHALERWRGRANPMSTDNAAAVAAIRRQVKRAIAGGMIAHDRGCMVTDPKTNFRFIVKALAAGGFVVVTALGLASKRARKEAAEIRGKKHGKQ
jgi:hypothetical protein